MLKMRFILFITILGAAISCSCDKYEHENVPIQNKKSDNAIQKAKYLNAISVFYKKNSYGDKSIYLDEKKAKIMTSNSLYKNHDKFFTDVENGVVNHALRDFFSDLKCFDVKIIILYDTNINIDISPINIRKAVRYVFSRDGRLIEVIKDY